MCLGYMGVPPPLVVRAKGSPSTATHHFVAQFPHVRGYPGLWPRFGHRDPRLGWVLGWYLRVGLDLDVVFGDEALAAVQLGLVPVLVVFHVEDLGRERSREASAWPTSPMRILAPTRVSCPVTPPKSRALTKARIFCPRHGVGFGVWLITGLPGITPNPRPGKGGKTHPQRSRAAASPVSPGGDGSVGGRVPVRAGGL